MKGSLTSWILGGAAALGLGYLVLRDDKKTANTKTNGGILKGSIAQPGDYVSVPVSALPTAGPLAAVLPAGAVTGVGYAILRAETVTPTLISGPVTHYQAQDGQPAILLPAGIGPFTVPVSAVVSVTRQGQPIA